MRWKTVTCQYVFLNPARADQKRPAPVAVIGDKSQHTLLDAVLIGLAVLLLLLGDALGALVVVVLQRGALLGLHALYGFC